MTPKSFVFLVCATAIGLAAAIGAVVVESRTAAGPVGVDQPLFPVLVARANEVAVLRFRNRDAESTIVRVGDGWGLVERARYPVPTDNVRTVVAGIASLILFEEKTDQPDLHSRLGVEDVEAENSFSREVTLETADGEELAAIILGRVSNTMQFDPLGGMYVRKPGNPRTWLVRGTVALPPTAAEWMIQQVMHIPGPDIQKVVIHEGAETLIAAKQEDEDLIRYHMVPEVEGMRAVDSAWKQVASGAVSVVFENVVPIGEIAGVEPTRQVEYTTSDGMMVKLTTFTVDEVVWVTFSASAEPGSEGVARADTINAVAAEWAYQLPGYKLRAIHRDVADLTEPIPEEAPPGVPGFPGLPPGVQLPAGAVPVPPGFNLPGLAPGPAAPAPTPPPPGGGG
jgi:hypothetical protein